MPYRKLALFPVYIEHRIDEILVSFALEYAVKRHCTAVGIPQRECCIYLMTSIFISLPIGSAITSVDVAEGGRSYHRMVQCCIENLPGILVLCLYAYSAELFIPGIFCLLNCPVEIPSRKLSLHVLVCILHTDGRQSHLHHDLLPFPGFKVSLCIIRLVINAMDIQILIRSGEFGIEIHLLVICPAPRKSVTPDSIVCTRLDECIRRPVPASSVHKVNYDSGLIRCREGISVHSHTIGRGELGSYSVTRQRYAVITRPCNLFRAVSI